MKSAPATPLFVALVATALAALSSASSLIIDNNDSLFSINKIQLEVTRGQPVTKALLELASIGAVATPTVDGQQRADQTKLIVALYEGQVRAPVENQTLYEQTKDVTDQRKQDIAVSNFFWVYGKIQECEACNWDYKVGCDYGTFFDTLRKTLEDVCSEPPVQDKPLCKLAASVYVTKCREFVQEQQKLPRSSIIL